MALKNLEVLVADAIRTLKLPDIKSEKPLVILFVGPPASGKTYLTGKILELMPYVELSQEKITSYLTPKITFFKRAEEEVLELVEGIILKLVEEKYNVIYDANFKNRKERLSLKEKIEEAGGRTLVIHLTCPFNVALKRIGKQNFEVQKGKKRGFILDFDYFYYEVNTSQPPLPPEEYLTFDSSKDGVYLKRFLRRIRQRVG